MADAVFVGTSGFSYKEWKGTFYPEKLPAKDYLSYYSGRFSTVEINNTFYRMPSPEVVLEWGNQVPEGFRFSLKLSQRVTHRKRLQDVDDEMAWFLKSASGLAEKLGCLLVQLPPWMKADHARLEDFLVRFGRNAVLALEFRHPSWFCQETYDLLRLHSAPFCVAESENLDAICEVTADVVYLRLRRTPYDDESLSKWAEWIRGVAGTVYVYLKHEQKAPHQAHLLMERLANQDAP